jgi:ribonuclease-3
MQGQQSIESIINYSFKKPQLLDEAFQAAGASESDKGIKGNKGGNKRLALVGDALIRLSILDRWYPHGADTGKSFDL